MLSILSIIAPVFALITLGYGAVKFKMFPASGTSALISFVNNFATPCLLFRAMLDVDFVEAFDPRIIGGFFTGAIIVFFAGILVSRVVFKNRPGVSVAAGFSGMFTNCVLVGIPITQRAYGDEALPVVYSILGLHAPILITLGMIVMELVRRDGASLSGTFAKAGKRIFTNPLLIGIFLGIMGNLANIKMVEPVDAFTLMMAQAVLPAALFGLGGALNAYRIRDNAKQAFVLASFKLFLLPALVWVLLVPVLGVEQEIARYAVVLAGMPSGINAYVFATMYKRAEDVASSTILISTGSAFISASFWLFMMSL